MNSDLRRIPPSLGDLIDSILKDKGYDTACKEWEVVSNWDRIAGARLAEVTMCGRVDDGVLYVKAESSALRQDLVYMKDAIKESIVRETGCDTIRDIVFY